MLQTEQGEGEPPGDVRLGRSLAIPSVPPSPRLSAVACRCFFWWLLSKLLLEQHQMGSRS